MKYDPQSYMHACNPHTEATVRRAVCETALLSLYRHTWETQARLRDATEGVVDPGFDVFAVWLGHLGTFGE